MYADMVTARHYEERLQEEYLEGKQPAFDISAGPIPGELHLAAGQEAAAAGVCHHLRQEDTVTAPHRPHHVAIAKGVDLKRMTAEIFGRETGLGKGKGGHMHLFDPDVNFACSGIIAEGCPPAAGAALAAKKRNEDAVAVAFLGEGAIDQGAFLESLNFASVHDLPVVFVVEDNDWAISMPKERVTDVEDGSDRAAGFDMPGVRVDRDDALAVYEAAGEAIGRARDRNGPTLLEVQVHRRMGHFMGDPQTYRSDEDENAALARDSIDRLESELRDHGVDDAELGAIRDDAESRVEEAIAWAKEQPQPDPEDAYDDVFVNPPSGVTTEEPEFDLAEVSGDE
ncbi:thiamine pyrophosphate-dependent dehydrogenase E1 component subunit alpha [Halorubrum sp. CBA1229]|uniref:thiamine pyrophosphate-dependent dehydrogenase E1 component subunit alpha n=1 Tax=Halorubrum sp. CBA1229 TaxID=1853699 RepID=UPI000F3CF106|nr:thiamine pyrophosphate-dependent dehydrogenase E1 component subunit alpha [Halorubrum sp. CBA1229]QKY18414.1 thiamine pyrophosphate-dependent dehydrogenase E1 component subunit alpha [Halorubrum sp. CBA1229]